MRLRASSEHAKKALGQIEGLQEHFREELDRQLLSAPASGPSSAASWQSIEWLRDKGSHGGGSRYARTGDAYFNRASINVSQVHYEDMPEKPLGSASALSAIVHPAPPAMPSLHLHISYTERKEETGYWRIMADLNPSHPNADETQSFRDVLRQAAGPHFEYAEEQGAQYFWIPTLRRHRGSAHFYLENFRDGGFDADTQFAAQVARDVIDWYAARLGTLAHKPRSVEEGGTRRQLAYHTAYFFQVLTLDRGTTSGLLVHDQNDVGILGSLPARIDRDLLAEWIPHLVPPQNELVEALWDALPDQNPCPIDDEMRGILAKIVRTHYRKHKEALKLQAAGFTVPPTVENHKNT